METSKTKIEQVDILGQILEIGNYVAVGKGNAMYICQVCKLTPKMIRAKPIRSQDSHILGWSNKDNGVLIYSSNTVKLSGEDAVAYILKYAR